MAKSNRDQKLLLLSWRQLASAGVILQIALFWTVAAVKDVGVKRIRKVYTGLHRGYVGGILWGLSLNPKCSSSFHFLFHYPPYNPYATPI